MDLDCSRHHMENFECSTDLAVVKSSAGHVIPKSAKQGESVIETLAIPSICITYVITTASLRVR